MSYDDSDEHGLRDMLVGAVSLIALPIVILWCISAIEWHIHRDQIWEKIEHYEPDNQLQPKSPADEAISLRDQFLAKNGTH